MFGELHQPPPGFLGTKAAHPVAAEQADYATMQAYADMTAAVARYAQLVNVSRQQHAGSMNALRDGAGQPALSPSPQLSAAKRTPARASVRTLFICLVIGAAGGFYARGQLLTEHLHPSQQSSRQ